MCGYWNNSVGQCFIGNLTDEEIVYALRHSAKARHDLENCVCPDVDPDVLANAQSFLPKTRLVMDEHELADRQRNMDPHRTHVPVYNKLFSGRPRKKL